MALSVALGELFVVTVLPVRPLMERVVAAVPSVCHRASLWMYVLVRCELCAACTR